ncbi:hypothetical protein EC968_009671 [Mortierella alpina]|nr:hypothetical protein EC968_009671 [Mortierella alpina]
MLTPAAHTVLATPELVLLVSAYLTPHDLAQCIRVCKAWSSHFVSILWKNFYLEEHHAELVSDASLKSALIRHLPLIRTVRIPVSRASLLEVLVEGSDEDRSTSCTNLTRFAFENFDMSDDFSPFNNISDDDLDILGDHMATLLDLNERLTYLKIPCELIDTDAPLDALSKLDHLQHLTVVSPQDCEGNGPISKLLQTSSFDLDQSWHNRARSIRKLEAIIKKAAIARFSRHPAATKIKSLQLPRNS